MGNAIAGLFISRPNLIRHVNSIAMHERAKERYSRAGGIPTGRSAFAWTLKQNRDDFPWGVRRNFVEFRPRPIELIGDRICRRRTLDFAFCSSDCPPCLSDVPYVRSSGKVCKSRTWRRKKRLPLSRYIDAFLALANKVLTRERNLCLHGDALQKRSCATDSPTDFLAAYKGYPRVTVLVLYFLRANWFHRIT